MSSLGSIEKHQSGTSSGVASLFPFSSSEISQFAKTTFATIGALTMLPGVYTIGFIGSVLKPKALKGVFDKISDYFQGAQGQGQTGALVRAGLAPQHAATWISLSVAAEFPGHVHRRPLPPENSEEGNVARRSPTKKSINAAKKVLLYTSSAWLLWRRPGCFFPGFVLAALNPNSTGRSNEATQFWKKLSKLEVVGVAFGAYRASRSTEAIAAFIWGHYLACYFTSSPSQHRLWTKADLIDPCLVKKRTTHRLDYLDLASHRQLAGVLPAKICVTNIWEGTKLLLKSVAPIPFFLAHQGPFTFSFIATVLADGAIPDYQNLLMNSWACLSRNKKIGVALGALSRYNHSMGLGSIAAGNRFARQLGNRDWAKHPPRRLDPSNRFDSILKQMKEADKIFRQWVVPWIPTALTIASVYAFSEKKGSFFMGVAASILIPKVVENSFRLLRRKAATLSTFEGLLLCGAAATVNRRYALSYGAMAAGAYFTAKFAPLPKVTPSNLPLDATANETPGRLEPQTLLERIKASAKRMLLLAKTRPFLDNIRSVGNWLLHQAASVFFFCELPGVWMSGAFAAVVFPDQLKSVATDILSRWNALSVYGKVAVVAVFAFAPDWATTVGSFTWGIYHVTELI